MLRFLLRRLAFGLLTIWLITLAVFVLFYLATPGDPALMFAGEFATADQVAMVRARLGLDQPIHIQYLRYMWALLHFDFGMSFVNQEEVLTTIVRRMPATISLALGSVGVWLLIAIPAGIFSARRAGTAADRLITMTALAGMSFPTFVVGTLLFYVLFFLLTNAGYPLFPSGGFVPITRDPGEWLRHMLLPWATLAVVGTGTYTRIARGSMLETLNQDYVRTARAKGLGERRVMYKHALPPALTPVMTLIGLDLGGLLGGTIITERIWGLNGVGSLAVQAIETGDLPVIMGTVLIAALFVVVANLCVDILQAVRDPRVRLS
ncbi:ABC transporter permease [Paradevosia shaoguanensis]|jgi:peptide/nickel transport system permease protein|uniref:ABC transporter permease n=1 Tax=Paradevosia shaoguanensis TaxID=1335043 RepID=A0AA41QQC2_9HYPH|nr:ABC transporter permease [Paradevosia shaoguanensis]KFL25331.1 ABC transporter permease [Devosia sp. 17-2-E-8]MBI4048532.1 ABC transporter permease [Devosia nanyangense]QMV00637.1 ABC transporter permease subunit [Devosia sp. D6-9]CDP50963.1 ABC transporter permease protein [Devosia sp. DBB001]MCF1744592.1 ABC transporter permease [Paradevosia shaoguanensis]